MVRFTVPLVPPSVNHYKVRFRNGRTVVSKEALGFKEAVALCSRDAGRCEGKTFYLSLRVILGRKDRGDVDNFPKLCLDGLAEAGVLRDRKGKIVSDAHIRMMTVVIDHETRPERGWTEFEVGVLK